MRRHVAVTSDVFMSANLCPTWNSHLNDRFIALLGVGGRFFLALIMVNEMLYTSVTTFELPGCERTLFDHNPFIKNNLKKTLLMTYYHL